MRKKNLAGIVAICAIAAVMVVAITMPGCDEDENELPALSGPTLLTRDCADTTGTTLTGQGEITDDGGAAITTRGFYYSQTPLSGVSVEGGSHINAGTLGDYGSMYRAEGTIELWMKAERIFGMTYLGVVTTSEYDWENLGNLVGIWTMRSNETARWVPYFGVFDSDARGLEGYADVEVDDGEWHHIAATWNCSTNTIEIYVDGVSREITYLAQETPSNFTNLAEPVLIGTDVWEDDLTGTVSDVRIWTTIRTEAEINENMHRVLDGDEPGLYACWQLDEGQGDIAYDSTANGNHGTLVNDPGWFAGGSTFGEAGEFGTGAFSREITGLQPATWYWIRAFADSDDARGYGNVVSCRTSDGP